jgi:hypothetical protein
MEAEVSALMSVADEALWNSVGLFTSTDELSRCTNLIQPSFGATSLSSTSSVTTLHNTSLATTSYPSLTSCPFTPTTSFVNYTPALITTSQPTSKVTLLHADNIFSTTYLQSELPNQWTLPHFASSTTTCVSLPTPCSGLLQTNPSSTLRSEQAHSTSFEPPRIPRITRKTCAHTFGGKKPTQRPWVSKKTKKKLVLGADIGLEDFVSMALCSLVGRLSYRHLCTTYLEDWVEKTWRPLLGYVPTFSHLGCGWIYFQFKSPEDSTNILECLWTLDGSSLMLKRWRVSFDPSQDYFRHRHLWVLLPGLPLYLWNEKSLVAIGNSLGRFISVDPKSLVGPDKKMARILVELDLHEGLLETLDIDWRGHLTRQKLDYLRHSFQMYSLQTDRTPEKVLHWCSGR